MTTLAAAASAETFVLDHPDGRLEIEERGDSTRLVTARPGRGQRLARASCQTSYPADVIASVLAAKGIAFACDEIAREEDPSAVQRFFENDFFPYFTPADFEGTRILDFGCGCGSSTLVLARMFPRSEIVGVDLSPELVDVARRRLRFRGYPNVSLHLSPAGTALPDGLGQFAFVVMSAVFEHLLPDERRRLMPRLWAHVGLGGCLLLDQTPHRFFPFESHTTGLPLMNYLPDRLAHWAARRLSRRNLGAHSWEGLLRMGIRGATEREVVRSLGRSVDGSTAMLLLPKRPGCRGRVDVWHAGLGPRHRALKAACREGLRVVERLTGTVPVVNLSLAIAKRGGLAAQGRP